MDSDDIGKTAPQKQERELTIDDFHRNVAASHHSLVIREV